jgi:hypothetical protein
MFGGHPVAQFDVGALTDAPRMARIFIGSLVALIWAPALAFGADGGPAVSDPNGKLSVEGGQYDGDQSFLTLGSYTLPLGHSFGLQADGALGRIDEDTMGGGGVHLFTRDPSSYLLGVYGSYHTWDSIDIWRAAAEFQLYVHQVSLDGLAGFEGVNVPTTVGGLSTSPTTRSTTSSSPSATATSTRRASGVQAWSTCCAAAARRYLCSPRATSATTSSTASRAA